jgi:UDP-N-acetylmuramate dehydrogenase
LNLQQKITLAPYTTFGIGGPARYFVEAATEDDLVAAASWARERNLPLFVLGGGSNLLVADAGFDGLVVHVALRGFDVSEEGDWTALKVAAGEDWDQCVRQAIALNCAGVECLTGIPGTVGGTPVQNVGAYGQEVSSVISRVRAYDLVDRAFVEFAPQECGFAYRRSRFNAEDKGRFIVTRVDYRLKQGAPATIRYAELRQAILKERDDAELADVSLAEVAETVRALRRAKGMLLVKDDADCRSAGSFFKNPVVAEERAREIADASGKTPPSFPAGRGHVKIPAAWLIEQAGFHKGFAMGAAGISSRHTLALTNLGGASAGDVLALADVVKRGVEARFGIALEMEPVLIGF